MTTIIVLFNLKDDVAREEYENWATSTDLPIVRNLQSVDSFSVFRGTGMLGSDEQPSFDYIEMISLNDETTFYEEIGSELMQSVAEQFQSFADNPQFILTQPLEEI